MPSDGLDAIRHAAAAGDPTAAAYTAVLAGLGVGEPQSWTAALERLGRAAELGSASARGQLAALAADADWPDLTTWLTAAPVRRLHPRVADAAGFLPPAVCAWLVGRARGRLAPAEVFDPADGGVMQETSRTNSAFPFGIGDLDVVVLLVRAKVAATLGVSPEAFEPLQLLHYAPGQTFEPHYDFLDPDVPGLAIEVARAGQRKATFLIYLNDGYEGGETAFPLLGLNYRGRTGDALMFANLDAGGQPARDMLHAGLPPTRGEKWLFSQWIRER